MFGGKEIDRDYRASLQAVRAMLERAGCAANVALAELRDRRVDVLTIVARVRALTQLGMTSVALSPDMESLVDRMERELVESPSVVAAA